jgi:hypothetical protein
MDRAYYRAPMERKGMLGSFGPAIKGRISRAKSKREVAKKNAASAETMRKIAARRKLPGRRPVKGRIRVSPLRVGEGKSAKRVTPPTIANGPRGERVRMRVSSGR